jgi:hypothetical protein
MESKRTANECLSPKHSKCYDRLHFSRAEIARFIHCAIYSIPKNPWNGEAKDDHIYKRIYSTVDRIHHDGIEGRLQKVADHCCPSELKSTSVQPGA